MATFSEVRQALADTLSVIPGLHTTSDDNAVVNPPAAVVLPVTGTFVTYSRTFEGACDVNLRAIVLVSMGNMKLGQDLLDEYVSWSGPSSIYATVRADSDLGGVVTDAGVVEVTGYGPMDWNGAQYLACHFIVEVLV